MKIKRRLKLEVGDGEGWRRFEEGHSGGSESLAGNRCLGLNH